MKSAIRLLRDLGDGVILAPERWLAVVEEDLAKSVPLEAIVVERRDRARLADAVVVDTTHAKDGVLDVPGAIRTNAAGAAKSAKNIALVGDLVVSRLRPYLRQIALVHPRALESAAGRPLALSTEFYVLAPKGERDDLAFLLPFFLGAHIQAVLAAAQEGGHHPRVPRSSVLALRVPRALVRRRREVSAEVRARLDALYVATARYRATLGGEP